VDGDTRSAAAGAPVVSRPLGGGASVIDVLAEGLRANSCIVTGPLDVKDARAAIVDRVPRGALVACNDDVAIPGLDDALRDRDVELLATDDPAWFARLPAAAVGITGSRLAVADPAAIALAAAPGSPRGTSLLPPAHVCVVRVADVVATLEEAMALVAAQELPSALTWIGGPSRTGDLEMVTTLGVHGPRAVDVVVLV
jgi:L-lactate dehydrogenase complex protein LldG